MAVLVTRPKGRALILHALERERARFLPEAFFRVDVDAGAMIHRHELQAIDEQRLLELVGDPQLVAAVARAQLIAADADVFVGIGMAPLARSGPAAHLTAAHEVGHELEARAVPRKEKRA